MKKKRIKMLVILVFTFINLINIYSVRADPIIWGNYDKSSTNTKNCTIGTSKSCLLNELGFRIILYNNNYENQGGINIYGQDFPYNSDYYLNENYDTGDKISTFNGDLLDLNKKSYNGMSLFYYIVGKIIGKSDEASIENFIRKNQDTHFLIVEPIYKIIRTDNNGKSYKYFYYTSAEFFLDLNNDKNWDNKWSRDGNVSGIGPRVIANMALEMHQKINNNCEYDANSLKTNIENNGISAVLSEEFTGYGSARYDFKDYNITLQKCDYNNSAHFSNGGPNGENCCDYFKKNKGEIPSNRVLWRDHPECFSSKIKIIDNGASCKSGQNTATVRYDSEASREEGSLWGSIYANMLSENSIGSKNYFVQAETDYCKLLCYEDIDIKLPLTYEGTVNPGGYLIWPNTARGLYPLTINSVTHCKIYIDSDNYITNKNLLSSSINDQNDKLSSLAKSCKNDFLKNIGDNYELQGNLKIDYSSTDKNMYGNGTTIVNVPSSEFELDKYYTSKKSFDNEGDIESATDYNSIANLEIIFKQTVYYKLKENSYRFIEHNTGLYYHTLKQLKFKNYKNYTDLGEGVIPNNFTSNTTDGIIIKYSKVGGFAKTRNNNALSSKNYTCAYNVEKGTPGPCTCGKGTINVGLDITGLLCQNSDKKVSSSSNSEYYTCPDAKKEYCDDENIVCKCNDGTVVGVIGDGLNVEDCNAYKQKICQTSEEKTVCDEGTKYEGRVITAECKKDVNCNNFVCNYSRTCKEVCPKETYYYQKEITQLVIDKIKSGLSYNEARNQVIADNCSEPDPDNPPNLKVIYRTISLDNPFPGKNGRGRTPGLNWNGDLLFDKEGKMYSRNSSVSGNDLYKSKDPMYVIHLTPSIIKEIRRYNDKNSYVVEKGTDDTFDCKVNNNSACISSFLHDNDLGLLVDGTCANATTASLFDSCAN